MSHTGAKSRESVKMPRKCQWSGDLKTTVRARGRGAALTGGSETVDSVAHVAVASVSRG